MNSRSFRVKQVSIDSVRRALHVHINSTYRYDILDKAYCAVIYYNIYKENPNWGAQAKKITPGGEGWVFIPNHYRGRRVRLALLLSLTPSIESTTYSKLAGLGTMEQSLDAIKMDGVISIIGFLGQGEQPGVLEALMHGCIIRGILVITSAI
jgi:hypothetical protein